MKCLAIVVDYGTHDQALRLARQLAATPHPTGHDTVIVDNGSPIPFPGDAVLPQGARLLRLERNLGYAGGVDAAVQDARARAGGEPDCYWILSSDLEVDPRCLDALLAALEQHPSTGAVGPLVYKGHTDTVWAARGILDPARGLTAMEDWRAESPLPRWSYIPGCSLLVRASAYRAVGGMPTHYRLYYEDAGLCVRLQKQGYELRVAPSARAFHHVDSLKDGIPGRAFSYFFVRNNLAFWREAFGRPLARQWLRLLSIAAREVALPLRRARNPAMGFARLGLIAAGLWDSVGFARKGVARFEHYLFPTDSRGRVG